MSIKDILKESGYFEGMKKITPSEYAAQRNITLQAVTKMIRDKGELPGIRKIEKYGRFYLLTPIKEKQSGK